MALSVEWTSADTTAGAELRIMLDRVVRPRKLDNATQFAGIVTAAAGAAERAKRRTR